MNNRRHRHPLIGLTTYGRNAENRYTLPAEYLEAVRQAGGIPLLLAPGEPNLEEAMEVLDGLVLAGGGDIHPERYGGQVHELNYGVDRERDSLELDLGRRAIDSGLPTLGICRGAQILNVVQGGTLIEHLPDEVGEEILHRSPPRQPVSHVVRIQSGSRLAAIVGAEEFEVASWHHQALRRVAPGFEIVAHAPDGTIEAIEMPAHPWLIAVQWHPELSAGQDPIQRRLFAALIEAARGDMRAPAAV